MDKKPIQLKLSFDEGFPKCLTCRYFMETGICWISKSKITEPEKVHCDSHIVRYHPI